MTTKLTCNPPNPAMSALGDHPPGAILAAPGTITLNDGPPPLELSITNDGRVAVHLTAHFHLGEANPSLLFDRAAAWGRRLDIPVGASVRIEPGERVTVGTVEIGGKGVIKGFRGGDNSQNIRNDS